MPSKSGSLKIVFAGIAQLVERRLAMAKVAGSSPVSRSIFISYFFYGTVSSTCVFYFFLLAAEGYGYEISCSRGFFDRKSY